MANPYDHDRYVNELRRLLASGQLTNADLSGSVMQGRIGGDNALAQLVSPPQAIDQAIPGQGYQGLNSGQGVIQSTDAEGNSGPVIRINSQPQRTGRSVQNYGYDANSQTLTNLGGVNVDHTILDHRASTSASGLKEIFIPGLGRGYLGKDGNVYGTDESWNPIWKASGYNLSKENALADADLKRQNTRAEMAKTIAGTKKIEAELNAGPDAPKPPSGYNFKPDGTLAFIPGGPADPAFNEKIQEKVDAAKSTIDMGAMALKNIDDLLAAPGFKNSIGTGYGAIARMIPGTEAADFNGRLEQLKGGAFLQAFQSLKGGGAISEKEGDKAEKAITRMSMSQSEKEFVKAAQEYKEIIQAGMQRAQGSAAMRVGNRGAQTATAITQPSAPEPLPSNKNALVVGKTYQTIRGPAIWNGSAFEAR